MSRPPVRAVARRLGAGLVVLWAAATAAYLALLAAPGDTVDSIVGDGADTPQIRPRSSPSGGWTGRPSCSTSTTSGGSSAATSVARTCCNAPSPR